MQSICIDWTRELRKHFFIDNGKTVAADMQMQKSHTVHLAKMKFSEKSMQRHSQNMKFAYAHLHRVQQIMIVLIFTQRRPQRSFVKWIFRKVHGCRAHAADIHSLTCVGAGRGNQNAAFLFRSSICKIGPNLVITAKLMTMQHAISAACETQTTDKLTGCFPRRLCIDAPDR